MGLERECALMEKKNERLEKELNIMLKKNAEMRAEKTENEISKNNKKDYLLLISRDYETRKKKVDEDKKDID